MVFPCGKFYLATCVCTTNSGLDCHHAKGTCIVDGVRAEQRLYISDQVLGSNRVKASESELASRKGIFSGKSVGQEALVRGVSRFLKAKNDAKGFPAEVNRRDPDI
jgi:hypothetical protein